MIPSVNLDQYCDPFYPFNIDIGEARICIVNKERHKVVGGFLKRYPLAALDWKLFSPAKIKKIYTNACALNTEFDTDRLILYKHVTSFFWFFYHIVKKNGRVSFCLMGDIL